MQKWEASPVLDVRSRLGEGPCWDHRSGTLYWLDIFGKKIYRKCGAALDSADTPCMMGTLALMEDADKLLLAGEGGVYVYSAGEGSFTRVCDPDAGRSDRRFNDGKVGPDGRFWAGGVHLQGQACAADPCKFYCIDRDFSAEVMLDAVMVSNGLAWSMDKRTMYYIDSPTQQIWAFDFDAEKKKLSRKRLVVSIAPEQGEPDGMTIDSEGMLWVAMWEGWCVKRFNPANGEEIGAVYVDAPLVACPAFGGAHMETLYITTASSDAFAKPVRSRLEGSLFSVQTGFCGVPGFIFKTGAV